MTTSINIIQPDDWHVHFRDNDILKAVVPETTRHFARAIVMPNLIPPIINGKQAIEYKERIKKAPPIDSKPKPPRIKFEDWNPPVEIIVKDKLNLSNILKSVKFKKKNEIKNIIT